MRFHKEISMGKRRAYAEENRKAKGGEWPFVVYLWTMGLGLAGYLIVGRFLLASRPHPYHWAAGLVGVLAGIVVGWLWYRWRGDVVPGRGR
jgi:hypothetical protein